MEDHATQAEVDALMAGLDAKDEIPELGIEINFERRYNLGDWNHKIFNIKITGTNKVVEEWLRNHKARLSKYIREVDVLVADAHETNMKRAAAEAVLAAAQVEPPAQAPQGDKA